MLSLGKSSVFFWHSKAQSWTYSLFALGDNSPTLVLDVYLETRFFFRSRQNARCSILSSSQYSKWQWWQFTVFLNSTSGSNFLKNQVHSTWGHSKAFRHVLKAHPSSIESVFFLLSIRLIRYFLNRSTNCSVLWTYLLWWDISSPREFLRSNLALLSTVLVLLNLAGIWCCHKDCTLLLIFSCFM